MRIKKQRVWRKCPREHYVLATYTTQYGYHSYDMDPCAECQYWHMRKWYPRQLSIDLLSKVRNDKGKWVRGPKNEALERVTRTMASLAKHQDVITVLEVYEEIFDEYTRTVSRLWANSLLRKLSNQ